jgi:hypothetical protein
MLTLKKSFHDISRMSNTLSFNKITQYILRWHNRNLIKDFIELIKVRAMKSRVLSVSKTQFWIPKLVDYQALGSIIFKNFLPFQATY